MPLPTMVKILWRRARFNDVPLEGWVHVLSCYHVHETLSSRLVSVESWEPLGVHEIQGQQFCGSPNVSQESVSKHLCGKMGLNILE